VATLEKKRKIKAKHYYLRQRQLKKIKTSVKEKIAKSPQVAKHIAVLKQYGYQV